MYMASSILKMHRNFVFLLKIYMIQDDNTKGFSPFTDNLSFSFNQQSYHYLFGLQTALQLIYF